MKLHVLHENNTAIRTQIETYQKGLMTKIHQYKAAKDQADVEAKGFVEDAKQAKKNKLTLKLKTIVRQWRAALKEAAQADKMLIKYLLRLKELKQKTAGTVFEAVEIDEIDEMLQETEQELEDRAALIQKLESLEFDEEPKEKTSDELLKDLGLNQ
jgi:hypothetical protein